jgi:hypothetical protein
MFSPIFRIQVKINHYQTFWKILSCLPMFKRGSRDDSIFGAARSLANTLGIQVKDSTSSNLMDTPMTNIESRQYWRKACFFCRCQGQVAITNHEVRSFCNVCSCLIPQTNILNNNICNGCKTNKPWEQIWSPCLACQFASIVFCNPFANRLLLDTWLPLHSDQDSSSMESNFGEVQLSSLCARSYETPSIGHKRLIRLRCHSIDESLDTIRS